MWTIAKATRFKMQPGHCILEGAIMPPSAIPIPVNVRRFRFKVRRIAEPEPEVRFSVRVPGNFPNASRTRSTAEPMLKVLLKFRQFFGHRPQAKNMLRLSWCYKRRLQASLCTLTHCNHLSSVDSTVVGTTRPGRSVISLNHFPPKCRPIAHIR